MPSKLIDALLAALLASTIAVITLATSAINATVADAYVLGAADGTTQAAPYAAQLGARTYRLVMDPNVPLEVYAPRVEAYRAAGMRPQIVVGGTGTSVRGKTTSQKWRIVNYAIHALRRWPDTYSMSVVNEPNLSGISACQYAKTFRTAYRMLKAAGAQRVLFGEFAPLKPLEWTAAITRCSKGDVVADGWAWHCYDFTGDWFGINRAADVHRTLKASRRSLHSRFGRSLPMYCTEYGVPTRGQQALPAAAAAAKWSHAINAVRRYGIEQIVAWGVTEAPAGSRWDTSVVDSEGNKRAAFVTIASAN